MKTSRVISVVILVIILSVTMTGCNALKATFGKEYRLVDDYYDQLEADIKYSFEVYFSKPENSNYHEDRLAIVLNELMTSCNVSRKQMKSELEGFDEYRQQLGLGGSTADYIEDILAGRRIDITRQFEEQFAGMKLLSTTVDRGLLGSIWHWIRNHWIISLIVLCVALTLGEKVLDMSADAKDKKNGADSDEEANAQK